MYFSPVFVVKKNDCKLLRIDRLHYFVTCLCIGDKGGEWQLQLLYVSSFQFLTRKKNANGLVAMEKG